MNRRRIAKKRKKDGLTKAELARMNVSLQLALERTRLALAQEKQSAAKAGELARTEATMRNDLIGQMQDILRRVEPDIYRAIFERERLRALPTSGDRVEYVGDRPLRCGGMTYRSGQQWLATLKAQVYHDHDREPVAMFQVRRGGAALGDPLAVAIKLTEPALCRYPEFIERLSVNMVREVLAAAKVLEGRRG